MLTDLSDLKKSALFTAIVLIIASCFGMLKITPQVYMFAPSITLIIMFFVITRDGYLKTGWSVLGLHRTGKRQWLFSIIVPLLCLSCTYLITWTTPYATPFVPEDASGVSVWMFAIKVIILLISHTLTSALGEELGWRGYLLPKLLPLGWKKAVLLTGFIHAEHLADEVLVGALHLVFEHLHAVVAPRVVHAERVHAVDLGFAQIERDSAGAHRPGDVGAEEVRHVAVGGQAPVTVDAGHEDGIPLRQLGHHRQRLRRQHQSGEDLHALAFDHLLGLAHAVRRIAGRVLDDQFDLASENAPLGVLHLGVEFGRPLALLTHGSERSRQRRREADLDGTAGLRLGAGPNVWQGNGGARAGQYGSAREAWLGAHWCHSLEGPLSGGL